jgi:peptidoglycan hydrolase-like protein with peptidoglycan-binding domain
MADRELGFTIFGPTFGLKGTVKKVQGRHAAIRLLVQASVLQVVGKYLSLPYWKLIPGMPADQVVLDKIRQDYRRLSQNEKIGEMQTCLYLKGYNVPVTGKSEPQTQAALAGFSAEHKLGQGITDADLYVALWSSLGENMEQVADRREMLARALEQGPGNQAVAAVPVPKATGKSPEKVATHKSGTEKSEPRKTAPATQSGNGPAAVAQKTTSSPGATTTAASGSQREQTPEQTQDALNHLVLGNSKTSAEALINERRVGQ